MNVDYVNLQGLSRFLYNLKNKIIGIVKSDKESTAVQMDTCNSDSATTPGKYSIAEGYNTEATGKGSHSEGCAEDGGVIQSDGVGAHAGGYAVADGQISAQGRGSLSFGHANLGMISANGNGAHSEGNADSGQISASSNGAHAVGCADTDGSIIASQAGAHAEGYAYEGDIMASGIGAHAEGYAEGCTIQASGDGAHAEGHGTKALSLSEHAEGSYNVSNKSSNTYGDARNTQHSIGIGTGDNTSLRKNAFEVMQNGLIFIIGVNGYDGTNPLKSRSIQAAFETLNIPVDWTKLGYTS